jgi:eukaryotic-like serine/threonine-protein kinase
MSASRLERIEALFHAALERPVAERSAFLVVEESNLEIRGAVERLLAHNTDDGASLRGMLDIALVEGGAAPTRERIGAYRIVRELGAGGMGTVFLAERHIGETVQQVALKVIRGFPTRDAQQRMARERDLLGGLNHPNIARLLDAGDTDDGQPYLVMDYVDGEPLLEYCATRKLGIDARLALFVPLCRAVQHAHQRLIVHRDIKPANVLVRADGMPMLLDFGIGKLLDATQPDATATHVFTPAYAAPEQRAGRGATTATDIYGLGCVLFELLSDESVANVRKAEHTLPAPSAVATDAARARALRGDLDTLVLKATRTEPERRYVSAQTFCDDVENYLSGRPLKAAPDSVAYRARKYFARHRYAIAATALMLAIVSAFVWRLAVERTHALDQAQRAEAARDFLVSLFRFADPTVHRGSPPTIRELLDQGSARLDTELAAQPQLRAELNMALAEIYSDIGEDAAARAQAESALRLTDEEGANNELRAKRLALLANIEYSNSGRFADAVAHADQALALLSAGNDEATLELRFELLTTRALALNYSSRANEATATTRDLLALLPRISTRPDEHRATALLCLVQVENMQGHYEQALHHANDAEAALIAAHGEYEQDTLLGLDGLRAAIVERMNDLAAAETTYRQVLAKQLPIYGEGNMHVTDTQTYLARVLLRTDRAAEALPLLERAQVRCAHAPGGAEHDAECTLTLQLWGEAQVVLGQFQTGVAALRAAVVQRDADPDRDARFRNLARVVLARGLCLSGSLDEGAALLRSVREPLLGAPSTSPLDRAYVERVGRECGA